MNQNRLKIEGMTLAVRDMERMLAFYKHVFEIDFEERSMFGSTLYQGDFAGLRLLLCPNEISNVQAEKSRHQLDVIVPDFEEVIARAKQFGGSELGEITRQENHKVGAIVDPDGNSTVVKQVL